MHTKYVLWRVNNGWLMTHDTTIWDNWDHRSQYAVFHTLKEFSDWVHTQEHPKKERKTQPRIHGKFASKPKPTNRITNARQPVSTR